MNTTYKEFIIACLSKYIHISPDVQLEIDCINCMTEDNKLEVDIERQLEYLEYLDKKFHILKDKGINMQDYMGKLEEEQVEISIPPSDRVFISNEDNNKYSVTDIVAMQQMADIFQIDLGINDEEYISDIEYEEEEQLEEEYDEEGEEDLADYLDIEDEYNEEDEEDLIEYLDIDNEYEEEEEDLAEYLDTKLENDDFEEYPEDDLEDYVEEEDNLDDYVEEDDLENYAEDNLDIAIEEDEDYEDNLEDYLENVEEHENASFDYAEYDEGEYEDTNLFDEFELPEDQIDDRQYTKGTKLASNTSSVAINDNLFSNQSTNEVFNNIDGILNKIVGGLYGKNNKQEKN